MRSLGRSIRAAMFVAASSAFACSPPPASSGTSVEPPRGTDSARPPETAQAPKASASAVSSASGATLFVAESLADCVGEGPMKCMRIRTAEDQPWSLHYDRIEGFEYEPGFVYELRVERRELGTKLADAPSFRYRLLEVVSKRKVEPRP